jgi:flagellin-specific chaperone FliS
MILSEGKIVKILPTELGDVEHNKIMDMYREERDKQYEEIVEECQEFVDEIDLNIRNNKLTQEEVDKMEEVLDGLYRWFNKVLSLDWVETTTKILQLQEYLKNVKFQWITLRNCHFI